ncbi:MAG: GGDEF domain-containing protein [Desulfobacteraceae bacterium]|nr:MAG: GGDEF domain-containing protein [Desulfobacteraceae bacterium]
MNEDSSSKAIQLFAEISIDSLKKLASKGRELSSEALIRELQSNKEIKAFFSGKDAGSATINQLEKKNKQTLAQKDKLLKQLQETENKASKINTFYRQALSTLINVLGTGEQKTLQAPLSQFKSLVLEETDIDLLSDALQNLKDVAFRGGIQESAAGDKEKSSSFFGKLLKTPEPEKSESPPFQTIFIKHLRTAYQDILDQFSLYLGEKYLDRLSHLGKQLREGKALDDFLKIRREIIALVSVYINNISAERELTAEFIKEIGKRLIELENYILESLSLNRDQHQTNQGFNTLLEKQIGELRSSVDFSKTLAELKQAVVSRLEIINQALEDKNQKDSIHRKDTDQKVTILQNHLAEMKEKISTADEQSRILEQELLSDPLTGANNRRAYDRTIENEMSRYRRYKRPFSLLLLDVDHFKKINDTYGHVIGDKCLKEIIKRIKPALRETDFLARYGGEEFIVILPETGGEIAQQTAERLRSIIENIEFLHKKEQVKITISIGATQARPEDETHESIFHRTDKALYEAKNAGRNRVVFHNESTIIF